MNTTIIRLGRRFLRKMSYDHVSAFAAQVTLFTVMSFFPFVMFLLTLIQYLPIAQSEMLSIVVNILPSTFHSVSVSLITEIYHKSNGAVISITAITAIWSASRAFLSIIKGLNSVYGIHETRNYFLLRIVASFYTFLFALVLIISLGILVFGNRIYLLISDKLTWINELLIFIISIRMLVGLLLLTIFFLFLFKFIPNRPTTFLEELPGALISSTGWIGFAFIFSIYVDKFSNYSYMYGSLTTAVLVMLWLYICMNIMFFGAEINIFIKNLNIKIIKPQKL